MKFPSRNLQKIKEKNISKCSLTVMAPLPFKLPFPRRSRTKTSQNLQKRKEKNVSKRSLNYNRHPGTSPFKLPFPRDQDEVSKPKSTKNKRKEH